MFDRITIHNYYNSKLGEEIMATLQEILDKIKTIASAGSIAEVEQEIADVKTALVANTTADNENAIADDNLKLEVSEQRQIIEALVDQLANAPAPLPAPTPDPIP